MSRRDLLATAVTHEVCDTCICLHVQRAARALARRYDEALRPLGLTNGQFSFLMALNRGGAPTIGQISDLLGMDRTTVTASLKPLARRGLVKVTVAAADKRSRLLLLTPTGRRLLAAAVSPWRRAQATNQRLIRSADRLRAELRALS